MNFKLSVKSKKNNYRKRKNKLISKKKLMSNCNKKLMIKKIVSKNQITK